MDSAPGSGSGSSVRSPVGSLPPSTATISVEVAGETYNILEGTAQAIRSNKGNRARKPSTKTHGIVDPVSGKCVLGARRPKPSAKPFVTTASCFFSMRSKP